MSWISRRVSVAFMFTSMSDASLAAGGNRQVLESGTPVPANMLQGNIRLVYLTLCSPGGENTCLSLHGAKPTRMSRQDHDAVNATAAVAVSILLRRSTFSRSPGLLRPLTVSRAVIDLARGFCAHVITIASRLRLLRVRTGWPQDVGRPGCCVTRGPHGRETRGA